MKKDNKKNIKFYVVIVVLVLIILFLLFMKGCSAGSSGGGLTLGGGGDGNTIEPLNCSCIEGYTYSLNSRVCDRNPCPSGWTYTQPTVAYNNGNCLPPTGTPTTTKACSDIVNPLSQRDCDVGTCSSGQFCYFYPAQSGTVLIPARCGC